MPKALLTTIDIDAPVEVVWEAFSKFSQYGWQEFFTFAEPYPSTVGQPFAVDIVLNGKVNKFKPKLLKLSPNEELRWVGRLANTNLLFVGEHYFKLEPLSPTTTKFVHGESFTGILIPLLGGMLKSTEASFTKFNEDLKKHVEAAK